MAADDFDTITISASSAAFSLHSEVEIDTSASLAFETYIDTSTWPRWNTLNPQVNILKHSLEDQGLGPTVVVNNAQLVTGTTGAQLQAFSPFLREGTLIQLANTAQNSSWSSLGTYICYAVDAQERRVSWASFTEMSPLPKAMLEIERTAHFEDLGNGRCRVRILERQKGPTALYYKIRHARSLQKGFEAQVQGLKNYVEQRFKESHNP